MLKLQTLKLKRLCELYDAPQKICRPLYSSTYLQCGGNEMALFYGSTCVLLSLERIKNSGGVHKIINMHARKYRRRRDEKKKKGELLLI